MRVWKFIWVRPLLQAIIPTAFVILLASIKGTNAQTWGETMKRDLVVFAGFYLLFVGVAALAWKRAVPITKPPTD